MRMFLSVSGHSSELSIAHHSTQSTVSQLKCVSETTSSWFENHQPQKTKISTVIYAPVIQNSNQMASRLPWSQRLSFILYWQILRREPLLIFFFLGTKRWEPRKESLWSRPLGTSLSCHQLLTVVSDWRTFLIALRVIWLDGLNILGDGSGV